MFEKPALILLAAGNSSRMGSPKQLLEFRGKPLICHAADVAIEAGFEPVVVVLGAREEEIRPALAGRKVEIVVNDRWSEGMGGSIQTGLRALAGRSVSGAVLALADQPLVTAASLKGLYERHLESGRAIVTAEYADTVGVPVFFAKSALPLLERLAPQQGCKGVILSHPDDVLRVGCPEAATDVDTPSDYDQIQSLIQS